MDTIRTTYREPGSPIRPGGATPAGELAAAIKAVVACWNGRMPTGRVRVVNQARWIELVAALNDWTAAEIVLAIEFYSSQKWNKAKGAWCTFDSFIGEKLTYWVERALEDLDRREMASPDQAKPARELARGIAAGMDATVEMTNDQCSMPIEEGLKMLSSMKPDDAKALLDQAARELRQMRPNYMPNEKALKMQAIAILKRNLAQIDADEHG